VCIQTIRVAYLSILKKDHSECVMNDGVFKMFPLLWTKYAGKIL